MTTPRALLVLTSHDKLGDTGKKTGWHVGEAAHPWKEFREAGLDVDIASIAGGQPPMDARDEDDAVENAFLNDADVKRQLSNTPALRDVDASRYNAIFFVGGHGTMWDFPRNPDVEKAIQQVWDGGGVVGAVCHGPAAFVGVKLSDGTPLVKGHTLSAFTNAEEEAVGLTDVVPFLLVDELEKDGATHRGSANFSEHVEVSDRLITGQNPASAATLGRKIAEKVNSLVSA